MQNPIDLWLDRVCAHLRMSTRRAAVRRELCAHLEDRMRILRTQGLSEEEAARQAVLTMGDPDELGRTLADALRPAKHAAWVVLTTLLWLAIFSLAAYLLWCILHST